MAITVTIDEDVSYAPKHDSVEVWASLAWDSSYPTGGEAVSAGDFGLNEVLKIDINPAGGYVFSWDQENSKILAYYGGASTASGALPEASNTLDLSGLTGVQATIVGR